MKTFQKTIILIQVKRKEIWLKIMKKHSYNNVMKDKFLYIGEVFNYVRNVFNKIAKTLTNVFRNNHSLIF